MKVAVLREGGRLLAEDWPRPVIGAGEVLLRLRGCGLCGSDLAKIGPASRGPAVLGHELVGDVVEVGAGAEAVGGEPVTAGDRLVAAHHVPCGRCHHCRRGSESMCPAFKASHLDPGGFAEFVRVPAENVRQAAFRLPPHLGDEAASFVEPLGCVVRALRRAGVVRGDVVVVVGLGSIGCLFLQLIRRAGATAVGVDPVPGRRALAGRFADRVVAPDAAADVIAQASGGRGADHVILTGGGAAVLTWAVPALRDGGAAHVFAGGPGDALPVALDALYRRELTVTATYSSSPADLATAFRLLAGGEIAVDGLYTHRVPLERLADGVELMRRREAVKVYVTP